MVSLQQIKNLPNKQVCRHVRPPGAIHAVPGLRQRDGLVVALVPAVHLQFEGHVDCSLRLLILAPQRRSHINKVESSLRDDNVFALQSPGWTVPRDVLPVDHFIHLRGRCEDGKKETQWIRVRICFLGQVHVKLGIRL